MCIYTSFHDYIVCQSINCCHRGSQSQSHSSWFIHHLASHLPTVNTAGKHSPEQPLHLVCCRTHVSAFVCQLWCALQVCQHPNSRMREWGAEALTALIKAGLAYKHDPPLAQNQVAKNTGGCGQNEKKKSRKEIHVRKLYFPLLAFRSKLFSVLGTLQRHIRKRCCWSSLGFNSFVMLTFEKSVAVYDMIDKSVFVSDKRKWLCTKCLKCEKQKCHRVCNLHLSVTDKGNGTELISKRAEELCGG